jgi:hypothetical protein
VTKLAELHQLISGIRNNKRAGQGMQLTSWTKFLVGIFNRYDQFKRCAEQRGPSKNREFSKCVTAVTCAEVFEGYASRSRAGIGTYALQASGEDYRRKFAQENEAPGP